MSWSSSLFVSVVWPVMKDRVHGGELVPVELCSDLASQSLDVLAGIDAWQIDRNRGRMRGIASRVQKIPPQSTPYDTFSIRWTRRNGVSTEFAKRLEAIRDVSGSWLYPALTVQAYVSAVDDPALLSFAIVRTVDLFEFVAEVAPALREIRNGDGSSTFKAVPWRSVADSNILIGIYSGGQYRTFNRPSFGCLTPYSRNREIHTS